MKELDEWPADRLRNIPSSRFDILLDGKIYEVEAREFAVKNEETFRTSIRRRAKFHGKRVKVLLDCRNSGDENDIIIVQAREKV